MKMLTLLLLLSLSTAYAHTHAQTRVSISVKEATLEEVFEELSQKTGYHFAYSINLLEKTGKVTMKMQHKNIEQVLQECLKNTDLWYKLEEDIVLISPKFSRKEALQEKTEIKGMVRDEGGRPLPGVTVLIKGTMQGTVTSSEGLFTLTTDVKEPVVVFSFIGMDAVEINYAGETTLQVVMKESKVQLEDVVVTGIYTRRKESFTGSASTYTATELKNMGSRNVLQSLKTLDPSFAILENNQYGSDPNRLPNMEIRGKSSMLGVRDELDADPNQPLFILDGFESTLATINDLDINRIASITILKDAASTAIYGSKAANGVVVVETVKPEAGELQVSYNGNINISIPDLSSYYLMNSREKLEFERLAGRYPDASAGINGSTFNRNIALNEIYQTKLRNIKSGVNTYWLAEPLRVGVNQKHALYMMGGEGNFLFGLGGSYNGTTGVMKKSDRNVFSGNIDLIYRISTFQFSNKFSINTTSMKNPIVSFQEYAVTNPYYKKYNDEGGIDKWLENNTYFIASNPLWNDRLNSRNEGKNFGLNNYFVAEWIPNQEWRVRARVGITYENNDTEVFYSREDTRYENITSTKRGEFFATNQRRNQYEGEFSVTYAKLINKHRINLVAGGNLFNNTVLTQGYSVEGFPEGDFTYPSFSNGYPENGIPAYYENILRSLNGYFNSGYSFDDRYLMDFSLRSSGSSVFGSTRKYNTTWSVGLGWNLHREAWIADNLPWVDLLKLRLSIGNPGNQSFDSAQTLLTYAFQYNSLNYFGLGALLNQIGNPDLKWQTTTDKNIGIDVTLLDKRFSLTADYFHKVTDPLLIQINTPHSSGTDSYLTNAGEQVSQGLTFSLSYAIIRDLAERLNWTVRFNGRTQKTQIDKIGNSLASFNKNGRGSNTVRYYDGADPDDIWAVRSAGIDPSNGKELFFKKEGGFTYDFSYDDEVICGNSRPDLEGVIGSSFTWKGLSINVNFRYQFGADIFNTALFEKVENIRVSDLSKNQDKRAFYQRWQQPGDIAPFKNIASVNASPISSRFVQRENLLAMESLSLGYEFYEGWIKHIGLSNLKFQFSMRDVFRYSTIRSERGITYPFARNLEAGLSFNF